MSVEENKAALVRWFSACNALDFKLLNKLIDELFTPDYVIHDPGFGTLRGREEYRHMFFKDMEDVAELHFKMEEMVGEGETIATRGTMSVTSKSTGKTVTHQQASLFSHFVDGKLSEEWQHVSPGV